MRPRSAEAHESRGVMSGLSLAVEPEGDTRMQLLPQGGNADRTDLIRVTGDLGPHLSGVFGSCRVLILY